MVVDLQGLNFHDLKWMAESKVFWLRFQGCFFSIFSEPSKFHPEGCQGWIFQHTVPLKHAPPTVFMKEFLSSFWEFGDAYRVCSFRGMLGFRYKPPSGWCAKPLRHIGRLLNRLPHEQNDGVGKSVYVLPFRELAHTIHLWHIYLHEWLIFCGKCR